MRVFCRDPTNVVADETLSGMFRAGLLEHQLALQCATIRVESKPEQWIGWLDMCDVLSKLLMQSTQHLDSVSSNSSTNQALDSQPKNNHEKQIHMSDAFFLQAWWLKRMEWWPSVHFHRSCVAFYSARIHSPNGELPDQAGMDLMNLVLHRVVCAHLLLRILVTAEPNLSSKRQKVLEANGSTEGEIAQPTISSSPNDGNITDVENNEVPIENKQTEIIEVARKTLTEFLDDAMELFERIGFESMATNTIQNFITDFEYFPQPRKEPAPRKRRKAGNAE
jgi:hypothetical protein